MLADGRARGPARLGERRDIGLLAGQRVQEGEPGAVAQEGEEFGGERELFLAGGSRMRIMRR
jgi:hypothetical protein